MLTPDEAYDKFKEIVNKIDLTLSESDSRAKILDPIFKDVLGWAEEDIIREAHVHKGYLDYIFKLNRIPMFLLEAKKTGISFKIPRSFTSRKYRIEGTITTEPHIKKAIEQVARYSQESGIIYSIISNGRQFIILESFKRGGKWREGSCIVFYSLDDILEHFPFFWNLLSKESISSGSLQKYVSEQNIPLHFERPLDKIHNKEAIVGKNSLAGFITPIIKRIFSELTDESQIEILKECYIRQRDIQNYDSILKIHFDKLPYYSKTHNIDFFKESKDSAGAFQISYDKCIRFLQRETPRGSLMILLGGIGSGKTTFIHHFFKVIMHDRDDIIWFIVDFSTSPPEIDKIGVYIYENIKRQYQSKYQHLFKKEEKNFGIDEINPVKKDILILFTMLKYLGKNISLVLDNVDQKRYTSPKYQESVFEFAQYITPELRTITILNLREESFFRATSSGVLDAYLVPKYHISSPNFETLIRKRINYVTKLLKKEDKIINDVFLYPLDDISIQLLNLFFRCTNYSVRKTRRVGKEILQFINEISGGDMRQALRFFNTYMTSGNTNVSEMLLIEQDINENAHPRDHYQIPLHHIIKSITLGDKRYYSGTPENFILNLFQVNPVYSNSHFIYLKILDFLLKRINYFVKLDLGFVSIDDLIYECELGGINKNAFEYALKQLSLKGLVEYDNQDNEGYDTAQFVKITQTGKYYIETLVYNFTYLDLMIGDTLISDKISLDKLSKTLSYDIIRNKIVRTSKRLERTGIFITYIKEREEREFDESPLNINAELTNKKYMDEIIRRFNIQKNDILIKVDPNYKPITSSKNIDDP